ncbi:hypothetical protein BDP81DRAFT_216550 [Colletotrichum phormii]|uniref:Uncharacterized protein n=1 Tax=Colletotrichum phormii TaxID=359342 RepID=A0AAJ0EFG0_9PEZI|nr:uncharacterized protein BDP81DRAFT_216550 [Colletotrichum phormii]KAK1636969.1 hypothetical protein BDP81DRAFT_216550 [Colletotrichum phormii]
MQDMAGGFMPINVPKRPLTPLSSVAISSPLKRLAVDAPVGPNIFDHGNLPTMPSEPSFLANSHIQQYFPGDLVQTPQTPPSPSGDAIEIPETPPTQTFSHVSVVESEAPECWMNKYVNLDKVGGEGFVPVKELPGEYHGDASETLSNVDEDPGKPFPELDVDRLAQSSSRSEETIEDDYDLEGFDEEELIQLLEGTGDKPPCLAPSSVIQKMDCDSRSASSFDSKLQFSEPDTSTSAISPKADLAEPNLLDEDVDWDLVTECAATAADASPNQKSGSSIDSNPKEAQKECLSPAPFVRPPFPDKMRDRSVVVGLSSAMMMRTCFRIGELLNAQAKCSREKQDVFFELFARVIYSNRENVARVQHLQLRDLFTERQPFLSGVFKGWKSGGPVDDQSKVFLGPDGKNKLCRCVCKVSEDKKAAIGRSATILSIRETTWDEVQWAMRIVARDATSYDDVDTEVKESLVI